MRIRVVKPDYWRDRLLAGFRPEVREFYIGLWMEADDAGWFRWQPEEVAADLYPYRNVKVRERQVAAWMDQLDEAKRVVLHPCGHAVIPTFTSHQRTTGGVKLTRTREEHLRCSEGIRSATEESVAIRQEGKVREGKGKEGKEEIPPSSKIRVVDGKFEAVR